MNYCNVRTYEATRPEVTLALTAGCPEKEAVLNRPLTPQLLVRAEETPSHPSELNGWTQTLSSGPLVTVTGGKLLRAASASCKPVAIFPELSIIGLLQYFNNVIALEPFRNRFSMRNLVEDHSDNPHALMTFESELPVQSQQVCVVSGLLETPLNGHVLASSVPQ